MPQPIRARCGGYRYFPDPLGPQGGQLLRAPASLYSLRHWVPLGIGGKVPQPIRARCGRIRYFPDPLGIGTRSKAPPLGELSPQVTERAMSSTDDRPGCSVRTVLSPRFGTSAAILNHISTADAG